MKFSILEHQPFPLPGPCGSGSPIRLTQPIQIDLAKMSHLLTQDHIDDNDSADNFKEFKSSLLKKCDDEEIDQVILFKMDVQENYWTDLTIQSDVLRAIHEVLFQGWDNLELDLIILFKRYDRVTGMGIASPPVKIDEFMQDEEDPSTLRKTKFLFPRELLNYRPDVDKNSWSICIELVGPYVYPLEQSLPKFPETSEIILSLKLFADFEIITKDGTIIPCHKVFLGAKSPDLAQMLQDGNKKTLTLEGISTPAANALLAFLYCGNLRDAIKSSPLMLELLTCADAYNISDLWKAAAVVCISAPTSWYTADTALALFEIAEKCKWEERGALLIKVMETLKVYDKLDSFYDYEIEI